MLEEIWAYPPKKLFGSINKGDLILVMNPNYIFEIKKLISKKIKEKVKISTL